MALFVDDVLSDEAGSLGATTVADWPLTTVRYFLVDFVNGLDTNPGYIDASEGSTLTPTGIAKKTWSGFSAIFPRNGAGRRAVVLFKNDSTSGTAYGESFNFSGTTGYLTLDRRASTDLTNSTTDRVLVGHMQALTGPGAGGVWTATAGSTTSVTVAAGLTAEASGGGNTFWRVRFAADTTTAALRNVCMAIWRNSTTVIEYAVNTTAAVAGDTFFIERPGVLATGYTECSQVGVAVGEGVAQRASSVVGIGVTGTSVGAFTVGCAGFVTYSFCEALGSTTNAVLRTSGGSTSGTVQFAPSYLDETGTTRNVGMGVRCVPGYILTCRGMIMSAGGFGGVTTLSNTSVSQCVISAASLGILGGQVFRGLRLVVGGQTPVFANSALNPAFGGQGSASFRRVRLISSGILLMGPCHIYGVEAEACAAAPLIIGLDTASAPIFGGSYGVDDFISSPAGGNTDVGVDVSKNICGGEVRIGHRAACTVSGTVGDLRIGGGAITTYAGLTKTNVVDNNGTNVVGTAGSIVSQCKLVTNDHGSALAVGECVRGNGTTGQVVKAQADALPATDHEIAGVMVTPPANEAVGYMANGPCVYVLTDGAPTAGATLYLDEGTAGLSTTTTPPVAGTNRKLRLGAVVDVLTSPNAAYASWHPENISVEADAAR